MKRKQIKVSILSSILIMFLSLTNSFALNSDQDIESYKNAINKINITYNTDFHIYTEKEYNDFNCVDLFGLDYKQYINNILETDLNEFTDYIIDSICSASTINVNIDKINARSTKTSKTVFFNNNNNKMSLTYKYTSKNSSNYFDTSYKPTVSVTKVTVNNYFVMNSYSGNFKNNNKTYSVLAKGNIITYYGSSSKSFTVNFNI